MNKAYRPPLTAFRQVGLTLVELLVAMVIALLIATGWILAGAHRQMQENWSLWLLSAMTVVIVTKTRVHILWLLAVGAIFGAWGLV